MLREPTPLTTAEHVRIFVMGGVCPRLAVVPLRWRSVRQRIYTADMRRSTVAVLGASVLQRLGERLGLAEQLVGHDVTALDTVGHVAQGPCDRHAIDALAEALHESVCEAADEFSKDLVHDDLLLLPEGLLDAFDLLVDGRDRSHELPDGADQISARTLDLLVRLVERDGHVVAERGGVVDLQRG